MELEYRLGSLETTPHVIMISEVKPKYYRVGGGGGGGGGGGH